MSEPDGNNGDGTGNKIINKVVIKATEVASDNKSGDWRKTLSGALDEQRLVCALAVLTIYYIGNTIAHAFHDNNAKDEDIITRNCTCKPTHKCFYLSWSIICYVLWFICHLLVLICSSKHCGSCCGKSGKNGDENEQPQNSRGGIANTDETPSNNKSLSNNQLRKCLTAISPFCSKIKSCVVNKDEIYRYEYYLWTQYYELYAIGVTQEIKIFGKDKIKRIFKEHLIRNEIIPKESTDGPQNPHKDPSEKQKSAPDMVALAMIYHISKLTDWCSYGAHCVFHTILQLFRFCAQLAAIPLLMIQMLDTYAFLCLFEDNYCTRRAQYNLHLDQTAITFGFYCSLLASYLTTIMLRWIPWPDYKKFKPS